MVFELSDFPLQENTVFPFGKVFTSYKIGGFTCMMVPFAIFCTIENFENLSTKTRKYF